MAAQDNKLMAITPAMREGSGMVRFSKEYPAQYFDVAIAEQHAVTLAAGFACEDLNPVVAIYSSFLQRRMISLFMMLLYRIYLYYLQLIALALLALMVKHIKALTISAFYVVFQIW